MLRYYRVQHISAKTIIFSQLIGLQSRRAQLNSFGHIYRSNRTFYLATGTTTPSFTAVEGHSSAALRSGFPITLERSIGPGSGKDAELWHTKAFVGEIYPDLPAASSWTALVKKTVPRLGSHGGAGHVQNLAIHHGEAEKLLVRTVAAQTKSKRELHQQLLSFAGVGEAGGESDAADALLLLSGSHPLRRLPIVNRLYMTSFELLRMASSMREEGQLPSGLGLWSVENPLINKPSRLERKVEAGAEVVITQPPLLWSRFEKWMVSIDRSGMSSAAKVIVGAPFISSASNLQFWLALCDSYSLPEAQLLVRQFQQEEEKGPQEFKQFCRKWNEDLVDKVRDMPGVAGIHVMPLTAPARKMALEFVQEGRLQRR